MKEIEIFEILKPNECYLIERQDDEILVASNRDGTLVVEWVSMKGSNVKEVT